MYVINANNLRYLVSGLWVQKLAYEAESRSTIVCPHAKPCLSPAVAATGTVCEKETVVF